MKNLGSILAVALFVSACATPGFKNTAVEPAALDSETRKQEIALLKYRVRQTERLRSVAYPIYRDGAELCGETVARDTGFIALTPQHFTGKERAAAVEAFALGDLPVVGFVIENSPAARSGLKVGDTIVVFDGVPLVTGDGAKADYVKKRGDFAKSKSEVFSLGIRRAGKSLELEIRPEMLCRYPIFYQPKEILNASATGKAIFVAAGMMRFVDSDDELATVIAHELAHNAMGHYSKKTVNQTAGMAAGLVIDVLAAIAGVNTQGAFMRGGGNIGGQAFSQEFELEADYVGLYFLARAGYKIAPAANLWRRMGAVKANVEDLKIARTHPTSSERFLRLDRTAQEIRDKIAADKPLTPEFEKEAPWLKKTLPASDSEQETPSS